MQPPDGLYRPIVNAGAPAANAFAGQVAQGGLLIDVVNGKLYQCNVTNGTTTATWTLVGTQT